MTPNTSLTIKEPSGPAKQDSLSILKYLNQKTGHNYPPVKANLSLIDERLKSASVEDCLAVIDFKASAWLHDPKMKEYLRPETLFGARKFAGYVGQIGKGQSASKEVPIWERT